MTSLARIAAILVLATTSAFAAPAAPAPAPPPPGVAHSAEPTPTFYQLEVAIAGIDTGPQAKPSTFTMMLTEGEKETIHTGWNVPYSAGGNSVQREQLGLSLIFRYTTHGTALVLDGEVELTSGDQTTPATSPTWHQLRAQGAIPMVVGTPTLFTSVYDIASKHRYEVTVTAKRLM
jgi:hypothetical protein